MKGRSRIIDEHELATLIRRANRVDWYEHFIPQPELEKAKEHRIKGDRTYHQFASIKDDVLTEKYAIHNKPLQDNKWRSMNDSTPEEGLEVLFNCPKLKNELNPEGNYTGTYFGVEEDLEATIVIAGWDDKVGYMPIYISDFTDIKWKEIEA